MEIDRDTFKALPPERQSVALFDGLASMPKAVATAVAAELSTQFVAKADCLHLKQPPAPPAESWLNPKTILAGLIGLGMLAGAAVKELRGGGEPPNQRPAVTAPATTGGTQ